MSFINNLIDIMIIYDYNFKFVIMNIITELFLLFRWTVQVVVSN